MPMFRRPPRRQPKRRPTTSTKRRKGGLRASSTKVSRAPVATGYSRKGGLKSQYTMTQISDTTVRITGRSYLGAVNNTAVPGGNAIGLLYDVNPSLLGDRVAVMASTYDKYCYQSMKFTYVPQCPTTQPGSVMLVFERDPEAQCANTTSTSFMQEVMSYEHAVLTPSWVTTSVTYKRDPHELKTWFMGGDTANLSTRETSQGSFIAYTSNATVQSTPGAGGKLGFVVMDFTLDLVSPNILPNKQRNLGSQQYAPLPNFALRCVNGVNLPAGRYQQQFFLESDPAGTFGASVYNTAAAGTILEVCIDGVSPSIPAFTGQPSITNSMGVFVGGTTGPQPLTPRLMPSGSRLYLCSMHTYDAAANTPGNTLIWFACATLADAIGCLGSAPGLQVANLSLLNAGDAFQTMPVAMAVAINGVSANQRLGTQNAFARILTSPLLGSVA